MAIPVQIAPGPVSAEFILFEKEFNKTYSSVEERMERSVIFEQNMRLAAELNAEDSGAEYGATKFADLTRDEFKRQFTGRIAHHRVPPADEFFFNATAPQVLARRMRDQVSCCTTVDGRRSIGGAGVQ
jgi:hypothetical protein